MFLLGYLIKLLPFQDDRFTSPYVSLLALLYIHYPSLLNNNKYNRNNILENLVITTQNRIKRCNKIADFALKFELQINEVAYKYNLLIWII